MAHESSLPSRTYVPDDIGRSCRDIAVDRVLSEGEVMARAAPFHTGVLPRQFAFFGTASPQWAPRQIQTSALKVLRADNACVAGLDGAVLLADGRTDSDRLYFVNWGRANCTLQRGEGGAVLAPPPARVLSGSYLLGFNSAYGNYAHWMADQAPALRAFRDHYMETGCRLLLPPAPQGHFINQTLELMGVPESSVVRLDDAVTACERLYMLSSIEFTLMPAYSVRTLRRLKLRIGGLPQPRTRRLFVSRRDSPARRLLNEDEVLEALVPFDVEVVSPGLMTLEDQVRIFHSADLVVGPHGAGVMNVGFCEPGAALLELFSEYTVQGLFWQVASHAGLRYAFQAGTSFDQDWGLWSEADNWDAPYVLDPDAVAAGVRRAMTL